MPPATQPPTFRDPAGSLSLTEKYAVRTIHNDARAAVLEFLDSPLRARLEERGDMVTTTVVEASVADGPLQLVHPRIPVATYPWEWTPGQWLAAANLTLSLCEEALAEGWILKDATPLNVLFVGARPVLVDVLSFEKHVPGASIWLAYGQYMRTFLLPLLMNRLLHWPLALSIFKRDGYEPSDLYAALGWSQRLSRSAFFPITLPAWLEKKNGAEAPAKVPPPAKDAGLALHILRGTLKGLRTRTRRALPESAASEWSDYTSNLHHYTAEESAEKLAFVRDVLAEIQPSRVLDIGANTGEFSALAASTGASVIALERDASAADRLFRRAQGQQLEILTVNSDLARPTPAVGWDNSESSALLPRLNGQSDLVLMLAVIHHLLLMEQIPLPSILELLHGMTRSHMVLEWVPPSDPMYRSLMRGRDLLYGSLNEGDLMRASEGRFTTLRRQPLSNGRVLFLMQKVSPEASA